MYRMNTENLKNLKLQRRIHSMWDSILLKHADLTSDPATTILDGFEQARKITRSWGRARAQERRQKEGELHSALHTAQYALERDP